jgi:hypothetical protein
MLRPILIILALLTSIVSLKYFIVPYAWICLAWIIVFIHATKATKNNIAKAIWLNLSVVLFVLGSFEIYLYFQDQTIRQATKQQHAQRDEARNKEGNRIKRIQRHDVLGYAPIKNQTVFWKRYHLNELIFEVSYTIDASGLRISPPYHGENNMDCVLFFGGSFTFGAGMNDNETMPYLAGLNTKGKFRIYNFGFSGYGPHQMLAAIQHKMVEDIINCEPKYVIYQGADFHAMRSAGLANWDKHGPKYVLNENGEIVYKGHFDDEKISQSTVPKKVRNQLKKSLILAKIFFKYNSLNKDDIRLMIAIIDTSKKIIETNYPGCEFHVIFWNWNRGWVSEEILSGLKRKAIKVHLISDILRDFNKERSKHKLHKFDRHPNQLANKKLAEYVSSKILRSE